MSENTYIHEIGGRLRKNILRLPEAIHQASGIPGYSTAGYQ